MRSEPVPDVELNTSTRHTLDLAPLIETHGYWVLVLGCLLEGETILLLAGYAAQRGYLSLPWVIGLATIAGFVSDQLFFLLGRKRGAALIARYPRLAGRTARVHALIERHHEWLIVGVRFAYGLRIAGPVLIGTTSIPLARFAALNALGAVLWAVLIAGAGWMFGTAAQALLGDLRRVEVWLLAALLAVVGALWLLRRRR